jgi:hypothetical protein
MPKAARALPKNVCQFDRASAPKSCKAAVPDQTPLAAVPANLFAAPFVHAVGGDLQPQLERHENPAHVDHVWITMRAGSAGRVVVPINTLSRLNRDAGFDERSRAGILRETWKTLPERGAEVCPGFSYAKIEEQANIYFEHYDRSSLERLLMEAAQGAVLLEVRGTPYVRKNICGIHQSHSRRPSCAISEDLSNRDGALKFYFERDQASALLLLKFCGQP